MLTWGQAMRARHHFAALFLALAITAPVRAQPLYNLYDLSGMNSSVLAGRGVNAAGQVTDLGINSDLRAVSYRTGPGGGLVANSFLGLNTESYGINASGQITGDVQVGPDPTTNN